MSTKDAKQNKYSVVHMFKSKNVQILPSKAKSAQWSKTKVLFFQYLNIVKAEKVG